MSKYSCPNSTAMLRETSSPRTGAKILPQLSKCNHKSINFTTTTYKQRNAPITPQLRPQEHRTCHHEDPAKDILYHSEITLVTYTPHHGTYLARNAVPHQSCIYSRVFYNQLPDPNNGHRTDGQAKTHERGTLLPMNQGIPPGEFHPHAIHAQRMAVASPERTRTLHHPPGSICAYRNDDKQHHNLRLHLFQAQSQ